MKEFEFITDSMFLTSGIRSPSGEEAYNLIDACSVINNYMLDINMPLSKHSFKLNESAIPMSVTAPDGSTVNNVSDLVYIVNLYLSKGLVVIGEWVLIYYY